MNLARQAMNCCCALRSRVTALEAAEIVEWNDTDEFVTGSIVYWNGNLYIAATTNSGVNPESGGFNPWTLIVGGGGGGSTLAAVLTAGNDATGLGIVNLGTVTGQATGAGGAATIDPGITGTDDGATISLRGGSSLDGSEGGGFQAEGAVNGAAGGNLSANGGSASDGSGGGGFTVGGGNTGGAGGSVSIQGGAPAAASDGDGGDITLTPGAKDGAGRDGVIILANLPTVDPSVTDAIWNDNGVVVMSGSTAPTGGGIGKQMVPIPAGGMESRLTNGPSAGLLEMATNKNMVRTFDFDATTQEFAQFSLQMPDSWNEGTVTFRARWRHAATTTNFGVVWGLRAVAVSDDDAMDVAFGTAAEVADTGGTTSDHYLTDESSAITIAGTPAARDFVMFEVYRLPTDGSDTMAIDAGLIGIDLFITTDAGVDT